ncbi:MAG TPA: DUF4270 domain-containing protein [Bacteroidales bacterium]|nr:DUF4270 domain-containing protein [Bacteroidales bacterium]
MPKTFFFRKPAIIAGQVALCLILFFSCTKRPGEIGADLLPDDALISPMFTDTITVVAYSIREDSVRTDKPETALLGSIFDPVFGTSTASFFTQISLSTASHDFGTNPQLDSLVLQLAYAGYYGDTTTMQNIKVYEVMERLYYDSAYYSTQLKEYNNFDFANFNFSPRPKSRVVWQGDTLAPIVRIRLSDISPALGNKLLTAGESNLSSVSRFQNFFRGLYLTAEPQTTGGAILGFDLPSNLSRLTIYYRNDEKDSLRYEFLITSDEARYNHFNHNNYANASAAFRQQVIEGDTTLGSQALYLQGMGGIKTRLRFPTLAKLKTSTNQKIVINDARLMLYGKTLDTTLFYAPSNYALVKANGDGTYSILKDQFEGNNYFGGSYISKANRVQFRLTQYVQDMVLRGAGREDHGLYLFSIGASSRPHRWIINGTNPGDDTLQPLKLLLHYSIVNE